MAWDAWDNGFVTTKAIKQESNVYDSSLSQVSNDNPTQWERLVTDIEKTIGGLTEAGAEDGAAYIRSTIGDQASVVRQNEAGAYMIRWSSSTTPGWTPVTTTTT